MGNKAIFLDRDGTLIVDKHYLSDPEEVELLPGVREFIGKAQVLGYKLYLFSNQSGVGRGYFTLEAVHACNRRMYDLLGVEGFDGECLATERPDEVAIYRKPSGRYIEERIGKDGLDPKRCWMVGDKIIDIEAALNGGVQPVWVATGKDDTEDKKGAMELKSLIELQGYLQ